MTTLDLWQLEVDDPEWLQTIITRLLSAGVPPTAIANAFDMDVQAVKDFLVDIRVAKYGTAELGEAMHFLMWKAFEDTLTIIEQAPMSRRLAMNMSLLSKASALVGGQTPDTLAKMQKELSEFSAEARETEEEVDSSIYEVAPLDAPADDPEKGPAS